MVSVEDYLDQRLTVGMIGAQLIRTLRTFGIDLHETPTDSFAI